MCLKLDKDTHGLKEVDSVKSATVMEDDTVVIVVYAKDSPICAKSILRFDVRKLSDGNWAMKLLGEPLRYPNCAYAAGGVQAFGDNLLSVL